MKENILILFVLMSFIGCEKDEGKKQEIITENAIIYYNPLGIDGCIYTIKPESHYFVTVQDLDSEFREDELQVQISYYLTDEIINCDFSGVLKVVEIVNIEKTEQN